MKGAKVLIVEDELIVAMDIKASLIDMGYSVVGMISSAEEAVDFIQNESVDIILLDVLLDGEMDGVEFAELLNQSFRIPVVFLTANSDANTFEKIKAVSPYGYIIKPYNNKELFSVIEIALEKSIKDNSRRESRKWLSSILSSLGDAVAATDTDGVITYVNSEMSKLLKLPQETVIGGYVSEQICIYDAITKESIEGVYRAIISGDLSEMHLNDSLLITADGETVMLKGKLTPLYNQQEIIDGVVIAFRDIGDDLKANQKFSNMEHCLNKSNDLVCILNTNFNAIYINDTFSKLVGKTLETLERTGGFFNLLTDSDMADTILDRLEMKRIFNSDVILTTSYNNTLMITLNAEPIFNNYGDLTGYMLVASDKRKLVKLEQEKFNYTEKYTVLMESVGKPVVMFSIDELTDDIAVYDINDELCKYLGMSKVEVLTDSQGNFINSDELSLLKKKLQVLKPGDRLTTSIDFTDADQQVKTIVMNLICSFNGGIKTVVAIATDQQFNKGHMVQNVETHGLIHDINNMLSVVAGYIHILEYELKDISIEKDYIHDICDANEKAMTMCRQILENGKETVKPAIIDVNQFIEDKSRLIRKQLSNNVILEINISTDSAPVLINEIQLEQVIMNLVKNAEEAVLSEGLINISVERESIDLEKFVSIIISDNGEGVSDEDVHRIFEPYYSSKNSSDGIGLGLSMVKSIVENHNGIIICLSGDSGTSFVMKFPEADTSISCEIHDDFCE